MSKIVLITGATSGIGEACAHLFAEKKYKLILCGRREERLDALKLKLGEITKVQTLCFDVRDNETVNEAIGSLSAKWKDIDILINNAGNAHGLASIQEGSIEDWDAD